jgi:hypothetical protein
MRVLPVVVLILGIGQSGSLGAQATTGRRPVSRPAATKPPAVVEQTRAPSAGTNTSLGLKLGTTGIGVELSRLLGAHVGVRIGAAYNNLTLGFTDTDGVDWDGTFKSSAFTGVLDFYPGARGAFRLSLGAMTAPVKLNAVGEILNDSLHVLVSRAYPRPKQTIGTLIGDLKYGSVLPYVGIGVGTPAAPNRRVGFIFDLGVAIGKSTVSLTSTAAATTTSPTLRADLAQKQEEWQTEVSDKIPVWPMLSFGMAYRF